MDWYELICARAIKLGVLYSNFPHKDTNSGIWHLYSAMSPRHFLILYSLNFAFKSNNLCLPQRQAQGNCQTNNMQHKGWEKEREIKKIRKGEVDG